MEEYLNMTVEFYEKLITLEIFQIFLFYLLDIY